MLNALRMKSSDHSPIARRSLLAAIAPWALVAVLFVTNLGTLVSERLHAAAFNALASIASIAGPAIADAVLSRSPMKAQAQAVTTATRQIRAERDELRTRNQLLHREHDELKASRAALAKEHDALRATAAKRASAVKAVATRTTSALASRSADAVASLPVRAAPYVGIAALVGFTTYELKADCEVARTLAELNVEHGNDPIDVGPVCMAVEQVPSPAQVWSSAKAQANSTLRTALETFESAASKLGLSVYSKPLK